MQDLSCLFSSVRNDSGGRMKFGFLPPHGKELGSGEEFTLFGNILEAIQLGIDRVTSRRNILAFEAAVERGDLTIVQTPNPILEDTSNGHIKMLKLQNGQLAVTDPCWESVSA